MASRLTEISLDCHDPDLLADFWCGVLDWVVAPPRARASSRSGRERQDDQALLDAVRSGPVAPTIFLAEVAEDKVVKNRIAPRRLPRRPLPATRRSSGILALGATRADVGQTGEESWTVLADPEGNEFCVLRSLAPGHYSL